MSATGKMADFVLNLNQEKLQKGVLELAKQSFIDTVACMIAGSKESTTQLALKYCKENFGSKDSSTVIGLKEVKLDPYNAAFVNGISAHIHDYDDQLPTMNGHPSAPVLPAVLAISEETNSSGLEAMIAYISGVEICQAMSICLNQEDHKHYEKGWHTTETFGIFGATAAAGKLLGLNKEQLTNAFGIAASESSGLRANFGTQTKPFHAGRAAAKGVQAAKLALLGMNSNPYIMETEGGYALASTGEMDLDGMYAFMDNGISCFIEPGITIKPYPCCKCTHNGIDAIYETMKEYKYTADDVERVVCHVMPFTIDVLKYPDAKTKLEGKFSMNYTLALTLLNERVPGINDFIGKDITDANVLEYMKRIEMIEDSDIANGLYTNSTHETWVDIYLKDGREINKKVVYSRGESRNRLSIDEIVEKLEDCISLTLDTNKSQNIVGVLLDIEKIDNISLLMDVINDASI